MSNKITAKYLSQEDLLKSGCLDMKMAITTAEKALIEFNKGDK